MTGTRQAIRQRPWASRLRGIALVAVLAIASSAVLPLLHAATGHLSECAVCSVFAHGGTGVGDLVAPPVVTPLTSDHELDALDVTTVLTLRALDSSEARAPPIPSVSI